MSLLKNEGEMKEKMFIHVILYLPFYLFLFFVFMGWSFEWEVTGGIIGSFVMFLFASACFYKGLKQRFADSKIIFFRYLLLSFCYYLLGPVGSDFDMAAYQRSGQYLYFVETNNLAGATSGVTAHISVLEGQILLHNGLHLRAVYNYNTAQFFEQDGKVLLKLGRTYMASDKYPQHSCFELSPKDAKELSCEQLQ